MKYLSVCSGIEAATVAWHHMGWEPVAFSEIEKFPSAVLAHHYPSVPNWGDMTKFQEWPDACHCVRPRSKQSRQGDGTNFMGAFATDNSGASSCNSNSQRGSICEVCNGTIVDVLVGGTPCQSFSVAGLRKGLADPRGNLMLTYLAIAQRYRPQWLVWENVPGVLSSEGGRDFAALLRGLDELGYGWAYRVLDAQYFGVAQRRRRVFVVGHLGDWHRAAAVLFERHSLSGHPAPSRQAREGVAKCLTTGVGKRYDPETDTMISTNQPTWWDGGDVAATITTKSDDQRMPDKANAQLVMQPAHTFKVRGGCEGGGKGYLGQDEQAFTLATTQDQFLAKPIPYDLHQVTATMNRQNRELGDPCHTLAKENAAHATIIQPVAWDEELNARTDLAGAMLRGGDGGRHDGVMTAAMQVRRLLPEECEKLQGFSRGYTAIPWRNKPADECPDGPRYKSLGNSMAVPVMSWIGKRINEVSKL